jgi:hypothetical protein
MTKPTRMKSSQQLDLDSFSRGLNPYFPKTGCKATLFLTKTRI